MPVQKRGSSRFIKTPKRDSARRPRKEVERETAQRRECIRTLFLDATDSYRLHEAARIIGISTRVLQREAERDQRDAYRSNGAWRFTWRQVAFIAMRRWTFAEIHKALGDEALTVLPPLFSPQTLTVQLPAYLVRAIETTALEDKVTVDEWLRLELIDFAGTVAEQMEARHPGFRWAYFFPGDPCDYVAVRKSTKKASSTS
jgi:hypothetical protein